MFAIDIPSLTIALAQVFAYDTILFIALGLIIGITAGAIPGLGHGLPIALALPLTLIIPFNQSIGLLIGIYKGGNFGGSITAVSFGTPGTSGAAATVDDGYALTKKGRGREALGMCLYSSTFGDTLSDLVLIFAAIPIGLFAPRLGPFELTALFTLSLTLVIFFAADDPPRGLASAGIGFFLAVIGRDVLGPQVRYTFGISALRSGVPLVPLLMGMFAFPEMIYQLHQWIQRYVYAARAQKDMQNAQEEGTKKMRMFFCDDNTQSTEYSSKESADKSGPPLSFKNFVKSWRGLAIGTICGTVFGALPGPGATVSSYSAYGLAKRFSPYAEFYGKGSLEGLASAESANSATTGATFIPLLTFGVPGSSIAALFLAALLLQGIPVGPRVIVDHPTTVYTLFLVLLVANPMILLIGKVLIPIFSRICMLSAHYLWPIIGLTALIGTYSLNNRAVDMLLALAAGLLGFLFRRFRIPIGPFILTYMVSPLFEAALRQSISLSRGNILNFFSSSISITLWSFVVVAVLLFIRRKKKA